MIRVLYTWKDCFARNLKTIKATDLVEHAIKLLPNARPYKAKIPLWTKAEHDYAKVLFPDMVGAGIIVMCNGPWGHRTRFIPKLHRCTELRTIHNFIPINKWTIASAFLTPRVEQIVDTLVKPRFRSFSGVDATLSYWAISLRKGDELKTGFICPEGQFAYKRMGMGLKNGCHPYARFWQIVFGHIPALVENGMEIVPAMGSLVGEHGKWAFDGMVDDSFVSAEDFEEEIRVWHEVIFPRIAFGPIYLKGLKCAFSMSTLDMTGLEGSVNGLQPSVEKRNKIESWETPGCKADVEAFAYLTPFLQRFIPGRAEHVRVMKLAYTNEDGSEKEFEWGASQDASVKWIKRSILENACCGSDKTLQYYLSSDASKTGTGGVLFQLPGVAPGTTAGNKHKDLMRLVMFMSFRLSLTESKYSTEEREGLAVMRNLDDCAWLVKGSPWPVKIYTDHFLLISIMQTNTKDAHGRLARWQDRLTEYNYEIIYKPGIDPFMKLADGLSRLPSEYCNKFRGDLSDRLTMCLGARKAKRGKSEIDGEEVITEADRIKYGRVKKIKLKVKKKLWGGAIDGMGDKVDRGDDDVVMQELAGEEGDVDTVVGCSREEMDVARKEREVEKDVEMSDITESVGELKSGIGVRAERIGRNKKNAKKETRGVRKNKGKKELGKKGKSEEGGGGCMEGVDSTKRIIEEIMENMGESVFERGQVCMEVDGEGEAEMGKEVERGREEELVLPEVRELIAKKAEVEDKSWGERGDDEVRIESAGVNLAEESGEEELSLGEIDRDERTKDGERKDEKWRELGELGGKVSEEGKREADNLKDYKASSWYGDVVWYLEGGMKELAENQSLSCNGLRNVVQKSVRFVILDDGLFWKERERSLAKCILEDKVDFALRNVHDVHGDFAGGISVG